MRPQKEVKPITVQSEEANPAVLRRKVRWTKEEDHVLKVFYPRRGSIHVAGLLGRSQTSVQARALKLGVNSKLRTQWKKMEENIIKKSYASREAKSIARTLKRSEMSVRGKIHLLGGLTDPKRPWSDEDIAYLRANYATMPSNAIASHLDRTPDAVQIKARKLDLLKRKVLKRLTSKEMKYIRDNLGKKKHTEIARKIGVDPARIARIYLREFGYRQRPTSRAWTPQDDQQLRDLFGTMPRQELADTVGRTRAAMNERIRRLGLSQPPRYFTEEEDRIIRESYGILTPPQIARKLNRIPDSVSVRMKSLGLLPKKKKTGKKKVGRPRKSVE